MLNSISAPPAFAEEAAFIGKTALQIPAASGSALRLTSNMIQMGNWTAVNYAETWTLQKHAELGFHHLSYTEPRKKAPSGFLSAFCRGGFPLCFLSVVILALSYKIGHYFCKRQCSPVAVVYIRKMIVVIRTSNISFDKYILYYLYVTI